MAGLVACGVLLFLPPRAHAQTDDIAEYRVKLGFLYNFAQFVQWPPEAFRDAAASFTICIAGQDPFKGEIAEGFRGRMAGGHPIQIKTLRAGDDPKACQMTFVRAGEKKLTARILAAQKGSNTLIVGETKGFAARGGAINLTQEEHNLRFEMNLDAAAQTQLKISAKLLALAKIVKAD